MKKLALIVLLALLVAVLAGHMFLPDPIREYWRFH